MKIYRIAWRSRDLPEGPEDGGGGGRAADGASACGGRGLLRGAPQRGGRGGRARHRALAARRRHRGWKTLFGLGDEGEFFYSLAPLFLELVFGIFPVISRRTRHGAVFLSVSGEPAKIIQTVLLEFHVQITQRVKRNKFLPVGKVRMRVVTFFCICDEEIK